MTITERAYAKINLFLDITGRRSDGYHTLCTVMQTVSLCDIVTLERTQGGISLCCDSAEIPSDGQNLAYKAAELFFGELYTEGGGVKIGLEKRIPSQAGLGGGSADAAAVLRGLNRLFSAGLSAERLRSAAARLGADVPFCITGGTALCGGIGEEITQLADFPDCGIVIAKPRCGVSTAEAYGGYDKAEDCGKILHRSAEPLLSAIADGSAAAAAGCCFNAFEQTVRLDGVERARRILCEAGADTACMSGSGSAVYGIFGNNFITDNCIKMLEKDEIFAVFAVPQRAVSLTGDR